MRNLNTEKCNAVYELMRIMSGTHNSNFTYLDWTHLEYLYPSALQSNSIPSDCHQLKLKKANDIKNNTQDGQ